MLLCFSSDQMELSHAIKLEKNVPKRIITTNLPGLLTLPTAMKGVLIIGVSEVDLGEIGRFNCI